ncbi:GFA family protein [Cupriavidus taiwanensis]|uniref:GFA family protein n=1 Tax=Cupriavidus taiwanensis TaxID=164546 RepID=UPI0027952956|nr:GFA family protein [Cupriavidus taiwanensis]
MRSTNPAAWLNCSTSLALPIARVNHRSQVRGTRTGNAIQEWQMHVTGRCHCGNIAYEAEVDPDDVSICHCSDCQMLSGSPYRVSVRASAETFQWNSGKVKSYVKTAASGARRAHTFCPNCGTPIHSSDARSPSTYSLRVGCLDQRADLPPRRQRWCISAVPWSTDLTRIPQLERQ